LSTYGLTQQQIESQKLLVYMDKNCEFESIYVETADPASKDIINLLIDIPALVQILVKDLTIDWAAIVANWRTEIFPYIKHCA
jgi:hypothetical protein